MAIQITRETDQAYNPVFLKILEDVPGGGTIKTNRLPTASLEIKEIGAGALLMEDASTAGLWNICKSAKLKVGVTTAACVTVRVYPQQLFKPGEYMMISGRGTAVTIASIVKATGTDTIIFTAGSGGLHAVVASGIVLDEAAAGGLATGAVVKYAATAFTRDLIEVRNASGTTLNNVTVGIVVRGSVNESLLPFPVGADQKTSLTARLRFA